MSVKVGYEARQVINKMDFVDPLMFKSERENNDPLIEVYHLYQYY